MDRFQKLTISDLCANPFDQFKKWFDESKEKIDLYPEAMSLSSLDAQGYPSSRYVLLRGYKPPILQFFTNYNSEKGQSLIENPKASLLFYWKEIGRQVRIWGDVKKSSIADSDQYWKTRPNESQVHAMISNQSSELENYEEFLAQVKIIDEKFKNSSIERPLNWGGFDFTPTKFEFWQEGEFRLHHRFVYSLINPATKDINNEISWSIKQLYP
jgi:pyridoxamine 5'-phosphate oxidase